MNKELIAALRAARPYVRIASERIYDGHLDAEQQRQQAKQLLGRIDVMLDALACSAWQGELESLCADARRMDWLSQFTVDVQEHARNGAIMGRSVLFARNRLREAIDSAMHPDL